MGQKPGVRLTADVAWEVCGRAASKAYFSGSIASLGRQYSIALTECKTRESMAQAEERT